MWAVFQTTWGAFPRGSSKLMCLSVKLSLSRHIYKSTVCAVTLYLSVSSSLAAKKLKREWTAYFHWKAKLIWGGEKKTFTHWLNPKKNSSVISKSKYFEGFFISMKSLSMTHNSNTGNLSRLCSTFHPMTAGIGSSPAATLRQLSGLDGSTEFSIFVFASMRGPNMQMDLH